MAENSEDFKVADRRLFTEDGELRREAVQTSGRGESASTPAEKIDFDGSPESSEQVSFGALVFSLYSSAMMQLGIVPDPVSGKITERDPEAAKQTIDLLRILQEKTQGNLTGEETQLLDACLCELKLTFVQHTSRIKL
jgi:hypothetical protein